MKSDENMVLPLCCSLDSRSLAVPPCEILNTDAKENSGQPLGMRKGINSDPLRADFPRKNEKHDRCLAKQEKEN